MAVPPGQPAKRCTSCGARRQIADRLLEPARVRGRMDLVREFSAPLAAEAISLVMGISLDDDRQRDQQQWSNTFGAVTSGYFRVRVQEIDRLGAFFRDLIRSRKTHPSDDLIQTLIRDGVFEDEEDLVINCMVIFGVGRITTQKVLGDGIPKLLPEWARWWDLHRENPGMRAFCLPGVDPRELDARGRSAASSSASSTTGVIARCLLPPAGRLPARIRFSTSLPPFRPRSTTNQAQRQR